VQVTRVKSKPHGLISMGVGKLPSELKQETKKYRLKGVKCGGL